MANQIDEMKFRLRPEAQPRFRVRVLPRLRKIRPQIGAAVQIGVPEGRRAVKNERVQHVGKADLRCVGILKRGQEPTMRSGCPAAVTSTKLSFTTTAPACAICCKSVPSRSI